MDYFSAWSGAHRVVARDSWSPVALVFSGMGGVRGGDALRLWGEHYARVLSGAESGPAETGVQIVMYLCTYLLMEYHHILVYSHDALGVRNSYRENARWLIPRSLNIFLTEFLDDKLCAAHHKVSVGCLQDHNTFS